MMAVMMVYSPLSFCNRFRAMKTGASIHRLTHSAVSHTYTLTHTRNYWHYFYCCAGISTFRQQTYFYCSAVWLFSFQRHYSTFLFFLFLLLAAGGALALPMASVLQFDSDLTMVCANVLSFRVEDGPDVCFSKLNETNEDDVNTKKWRRMTKPKWNENSRVFVLVNKCLIQGLRSTDTQENALRERMKGFVQQRDCSSTLRLDDKKIVIGLTEMERKEKI